MLKEKPRIVVIAGPTGIGKTGAALYVAENTGAEIISADAMAVYRSMDIGTAKPTAEEQSRAPHHLIDVVDPDEPYDAARFAREAAPIALDLAEKGTPVIVAGGTGLYIKALVHGLFSAGTSDPALRERLRQEARDSGLSALHERLCGLDPEAVGRIHKNDAFRIIRALEVIELTGKPLSGLHKEHAFGKPRFNALYICLTMDREALYARINKRVDLMLEQGLLDEVKGLLDKGYSPELKSMGSLGYRHMVQVLLGQTDMPEAVRLMKRDTRRFAKRQLTWFNSIPDLVRAEPGDLEKILAMAEHHWKTGP